MIKRIVRGLGLTVLLVAVLGGVLYQFFGLRVVLDGGGMPHLAFVTPTTVQAAQIERHRDAQRLTEPAPANTPVSTAATSVGATVTVTSVVSAAANSSDWSDIRGAARDGVYRGQPVLTTWPGGRLTPMWKQPVGGGYASFVTAKIDGSDRAFTIEQRGREEVVAAYDVATGRELWTNKWTGEFKEFMGGDGPRATPTYFDGHLYALGALGEFRDLDAATGRTLWRTSILDDAGASNLQWGMSASPLIVGDTVVVLPGGSSHQSVVAYHRSTGKKAWSALNDHQAYVSPMLVTLAGTRQLVVISASRMVGLTPDRGELLWEYPWVTQYDINAAQPIVIGENRVFISSGYDNGAAVVEIGKSGAAFTVRQIWKNNRMKNRFASSVLYEGHIYGLDESIMACVDAATGDLKWKGGRYGYGQLVLASGHLIVVTEEGDLVLVRATPARHEELAHFPVLSGKTWNIPAFSDGRLLVRNLREMAAFDLRLR